MVYHPIPPLLPESSRWVRRFTGHAMNYVDLVALLVVAQLVSFAVLVGRVRGRYGVKASAVSGHEGFERVYRVQMNTLELLVAFLPALFIAAK